MRWKCFLSLQEINGDARMFWNIHYLHTEAWSKWQTYCKRHFLSVNDYKNWVYVPTQPRHNPRTMTKLLLQAENISSHQKMTVHKMYTVQTKSSWYYSDVIMSAMASQITSVSIVYSAIYSGADLRKHQNSASLAFVRGIHRWLVNSPHTRTKGQ